MLTSNHPMLGVITTTVPSWNTPRKSQAPLQPKAVWRHLTRAAHEHGLSVCLFHPSDLDIHAETIRGYVCEGEPDQDWKRHSCSLPDIVYDNVFVHHAAKREVREARLFFLRKGIPLFNPRLGDKYELCQWVRKFPKLWEHHPDTELLKREEQLFPLLQRFPCVYLKPLQGSSGQGILEISAPAGGVYRVRAAKFRNTKKPYEAELTRAQLEQLIRSERKRCSFLVQEGVELLQVKQGKVDVRTHLQRNREGEWETVGVVVKRGRPHSIVSNYHAGGSRHDWAWLQDFARWEGITLPELDKLLELSQRIANAFTKKAPHLAALGLDLGLDDQGQIWLLDINARPGRNILDAQQKKRCMELHAAFAAFLLDPKTR